MIHFPVFGDAFNVVLDSLSERIADCWSYLWLLAELTVNYDKDWDTGTFLKSVPESRMTVLTTIAIARFRH